MHRDGQVWRADKSGLDDARVRTTVFLERYAICTSKPEPLERHQRADLTDFGSCADVPRREPKPLGTNIKLLIYCAILYLMWVVTGVITRAGFYAASSTRHATDHNTFMV